MTQKDKRDFQRAKVTISPGPAKYIIPNDPGHKLPKHQKPLSQQHSFIDHQKNGTFEKEARNSFYSGDYK